MIIRDYPKRNSILILELIFYTELKKLARLGLPFYGLYYIRPTIFRTYPHVVFQQLQTAVGPMSCRSDPHFIEKKLELIRPTSLKKS